MGELIAEPELLAPPRFATTIPALALEAKNRGLEIPETWHRKLLSSAVSHLVLKAQLDSVGRALDSAGIPWMPIKGMDLGYRLWPSPEARPTSDLDVLVPISRLAEGRAILVEAGWEGLKQGPDAERYLEDEGYNWQARNASGTLLELHYRLWGSMPTGWVDSVWETSLDAPQLGSAARCPSWSDAYLICAVHLWNLPPPHALLYFRELELIVRRGGQTVLGEVGNSAPRWGFALHVCLAATYAFRLWQNPAMAALAESSRADLHFPERVLFRSAVGRGMDAASLSQLTVARLLSGRETRHGWKAGLRRIWPHPANRARRITETSDRVRSTSEP